MSPAKNANQTQCCDLIGAATIQRTQVNVLFVSRPYSAWRVMVWSRQTMYIHAYIHVLRTYVCNDTRS